MRDLTFAIRLLRRSPGHTAIMILVLAVGIGAATTMFSIMDGVLLRRLPVADQDQVVALWLQNRLGELKHLPLDDATFSDFRDQSTAFERLGAIDFNGAWPYVLLDGDEAVTLKGTGVTGDLFPTLGIVPALGRILLPAAGDLSASGESSSWHRSH